MTAIGLLSALVEFSSIWLSFIFGIGVWLLTTGVEKVIFSYNSLFVYSMPDFDINPDLWLGAFFGFAEPPGAGPQIPVVGWIMGDVEYAKKVHALLLRWAYGQRNDEEDNIRASVVTLDDNEYIFFCYPNINRKSAKDYFKAVEGERRKVSLTDVQNKQFALLIFGKRCQITERSYFPTFRQRYRDGVPYLFRLVTLTANGEPEAIPGIADLTLHNLKIKSRVELGRTDIEHDLLRIQGV
ncbi:MAG: hypothetical protein ABI886_03130 [Betaproteobacteria bacterium]